MLDIIVILLLAKAFGELAQRLGQPPVLGELIAGVILGGSVLGFIKLGGRGPLSPELSTLLFLAQLGVILLLFEVGLASDLGEFVQVWPSALLVTCVGVTGTFVIVSTITYLFVHNALTATFIGAALSATSIGITARTLHDLGVVRTSTAKIIIGAAVIDDILTLIVLAVMSRLATTGIVSFWQVAKVAGLAIVFLAGSVLIGIPVAPYILRIAKRLRVRGMLTVSAFLFCLTLAYISHAFGLAAIIGAFAAGLVLSKTDDLVHIEDRIKPLADVLIPIFFVMLGVSVNLRVFNPFNPQFSGTLGFTAALIAIAIVTKSLSGLGVRKRGISRLVVGIGMIPRGEVSLIFASIGLAAGIITGAQYSAVIAVVAVTTFVTPPLLRWALSRDHKSTVACTECD